MTEEEIQLVNDVKATFGTDSGKRFLRFLSDYCYEKRNTYVESNHDKQNVNNGKRAVILYIRSLMETDLNKPVQNLFYRTAQSRQKQN